MNGFTDTLLAKFEDNLCNCWCCHHYSHFDEKGKKKLNYAHIKETLDHFYDVQAIKDWLLHGEEADHGTTNLDLLHKACRSTDQVSPFSPFPVTSDQINQHQYLRTFITLISMGKGHYIKSFYDAGYNDDYMDTKDIPSQITSNLKERLQEVDANLADTFIENFETLKYSFCRVEFDLGMNQDFKGPVILPFCYKKQIMSGGTSVVYKVVVEERFISQRLREVLGKPQDHDIWGKCYIMALKTYPQRLARYCKHERNILVNLQSVSGIIKYLGSYSTYEGEEQTYNLLLEYCSQDLDEYLSDTGISPPVTAREITRFYQDIFKIAEALRSINDLQLDGVHWLGFHADVKPENILFVQNKFKLIDFGFSLFEENNSTHNIQEGVPQEKFLGWTTTYGAPEIGRDLTITAKIDSWSFGCVLILVATWIVLGQQGVAEFQKFRQIAQQRQGPKDSESSKREPTYLADGSNVIIDDAYHDGKRLLPLISGWIERLKQLARGSDASIRITQQVLDLAERHMLRAAPENRFSFIDICKEWAVIIEKTESTLFWMDEQVTEREKEVKDVLEYIETAVVETQKQPSSRKAIHVKVGSSHGKSTAVITMHSMISSLRPEKEAILRRNSVRRTPGRVDPNNNNLHAEVLDEATRSGRASVVVATNTRATAPQVINAAIPSSTIPRRPKLPIHHGLIPPPLIEDGSEGASEGTASARASTVPEDGAEAVLTLSVPQSTTSPTARSFVSTSLNGNTAPPVELPISPMSPQATHIESYSTILSATPTQVYPSLDDIPWHIFETRKRLDKQSRGFRKTVGRVGQKMLGIETGDKDYQNDCQDRDFVFIVDNAESMLQYRYLTAYILETLAMQLRGCDKDGLDLRFTGDSRAMLKKKYDAAEAFRNMVLEDNTWKHEDNTIDHNTHMAKALKRIFQGYLQMSEHIHPQAQTLIIITDGLWKDDGPENETESMIVEYIREIHKKWRLEARHFTIQFVRMGSYRTTNSAVLRLRRLDDQLSKSYRLRDSDTKEFPDVVDHIHFSGKVDKMIKGSFLLNQDKGNEEGVLINPATNQLLPYPENIDSLCRDFYSKLLNRILSSSVPSKERLRASVVYDISSLSRPA